MTDIDPAADIEFHSVDGHVTVRVPRAGPVTSGWLGCYQQLARATGVVAQAQAHRDRAWIVVHVPASSDDGKVVAALDSAPGLLPSEVIECGGGHQTWPPVSISTTTKLRVVVNGSRPRRRIPALVGP